jgi:RNA polymerase sigma factor (sigma-70 family)
VSRRSRDDGDPLDPSGRASRLVWLYSGTPDGKDLAKQQHPMDVRCDNCGKKRSSCVGKCCDDCWHPETQPASETRAYAPAPLDDREQAEEQQQRRNSAVYELSLLTEDERTAWELHETVEGWITKKSSFLASERDQREKDGWFYVGKQGNGRIQMSKQFQSKLTYVQMGERMGVSAERVHSLIKSARRKLRTKQ